MKALFYLTILSIVLIASAHIIDEPALNEPVQHECIHHKIAQEFKPLPNLSEEAIADRQRRRILTSGAAVNPATAQNIRFHFDYSSLDTSSATVDQKNFIKNNLMPSSSAYLSDLIKVNRVQGKLKFPSSYDKCYQVTVPSHMKSTGVDADMVIFISAANEPQQSFIAWATSCIQDYASGSKRPIFGQVNFNLAKLDMTPSKFSAQISTVIHEITHALAFSSHLYDDFIDSNGNTRSIVKKNDIFRGVQNTMIVTPKVKEVTRAHFGCSTAEGMELENEGGSGSKGSHWERLLLSNEAMTASDIPNAAFSKFTLALLEDSGWYAPVYEKAMPFYWGANDGCDFLHKACNASPRPDEFCDINTQQGNQCGYNGAGISSCQSSQFTQADKCYTFQQYSNGDCSDPENNNSPSWSTGVNYFGYKFGPNSKCARNDVIISGYSRGGLGAGCFEYTCQNGKVVYKIGSGTVTCTDGATVNVPSSTGFTGTIECPNASFYCQKLYPKCKNDCSLNGFCHNGVCKCRDGKGGEDCSQDVDSSDDSSSGSTDSGSTDSGSSSGGSTDSGSTDSGSSSGGSTDSGSTDSGSSSGGSTESTTPVEKECPKVWGMECYQLGDCDKSTGTCNCYDGMSGSDCTTKSPQCNCPSDVTTYWVVNYSRKMVWCQCGE